jgi:hypothetical protein
LQLHKEPKKSLFTSLVYFLLFTFHYFILFALLIPKPCAWQPLDGVGDARQGDCFVGCLMRTKRDFLTVSQEFDIYPESSLWEKLLLLQHSALEVLKKWHIA